MFLTVRWISQAAEAIRTFCRSFLQLLCGPSLPHTSGKSSTRLALRRGIAGERSFGDGNDERSAFAGRNRFGAGLGRTSSLQWGIRHAAFGNRRSTSAHPLFCCCAGARRDCPVHDRPRRTLAVAQTGSRQDACCLRRRSGEILCRRRARQWRLTPMPARA